MSLPGSTDEWGRTVCQVVGCYDAAQPGRWTIGLQEVEVWLCRRHALDLRESPRTQPEPEAAS